MKYQRNEQRYLKKINVAAKKKKKNWLHVIDKLIVIYSN